MGELLFVGVGLCDERDLSERALGELARCERLFAEGYTSVLAPGSFERLSGRLGRPVTVLGREEVEGQAAILDALGASGRVALLVAGDPFAATTHVALRLAAERAGHTWRYLPNASILTAAAGFLGLQQYRFGRTVSLPLPEPGFEPRSPVDGIASNRASGLHTLVLLDLRPAEGRFLGPVEALRILRARDPEGRALDPGREVAVVARVGTPSAKAWLGVPSRLEAEEFGPPLHAIVVPAPDLHFGEGEALGRFRVR